MILFLSYAVGMIGLLWYTVFYLPFGEVTQHFSFLLNFAQLAAVSLLSFLVYRQETTFRSIFFQFWFLYAYMVLFPPAFYHCMHWYGNNGGMAAAVIGLIVLHGLFLWLSLKIALHYVFRDEKLWVINSLATLVLLPLCLWLFWPFWWSPDALRMLPTAANPATIYRPVEQKLILTNGVSLLLLLAFFVHKLRTDRPIGVYADTLLFFFAIYIIVDTAEYAARITSLELMSMTQWAAALVTAAMIVTLMLRLKFKSQTIARYYESQCVSGDPHIDRRIGRFDRLIVRCFFDPQKVSQRVFLGAGNAQMKVKRSSSRVMRNADQD